MKSTKLKFAIVLVIFPWCCCHRVQKQTMRATPISLHLVSLLAQTVNKQCINTCRARYRDCRRLNRVPSFECRGVYQDCTRYACTGLGPG